MIGTTSEKPNKLSPSRLRIRSRQLPAPVSNEKPAASNPVQMIENECSKCLGNNGTHFIQFKSKWFHSSY